MAEELLMVLSNANLPVDKNAAFFYNENLVNWLKNEYWQTIELLANSVSSDNVQILIELRIRADFIKVILNEFNDPSNPKQE